MAKVVIVDEYMSELDHYPDRRMVYFTDMADVKAKQPALVRAIKEWIERIDA
jgi:hypothetical protein